MRVVAETMLPVCSKTSTLVALVVSCLISSSQGSVELRSALERIHLSSNVLPVRLSWLPIDDRGSVLVADVVLTADRTNPDEEVLAATSATLRLWSEESVANRRLRSHAGLAMFLDVLEDPEFHRPAPHWVYPGPAPTFHVHQPVLGLADNIPAAARIGLGRTLEGVPRNTHPNSRYALDKFAFVPFGGLGGDDSAAGELLLSFASPEPLCMPGSLTFVPTIDMGAWSVNTGIEFRGGSGEVLFSLREPFAISFDPESPVDVLPGAQFMAFEAAVTRSGLTVEPAANERGTLIFGGCTLENMPEIRYLFSALPSPSGEMGTRLVDVVLYPEDYVDLIAGGVCRARVAQLHPSRRGPSTVVFGSNIFRHNLIHFDHPRSRIGICQPL